MSPLLLSLSTLPYTLLLLLEAALLLHYAPSPSSICHAVVLLLPPFFLSSLDTPTSYVPYPHIQSIMASLSLLLASSLPSIHTALLYSSIPQIYSPPLSSSSVLLLFYNFRQDAQTSHIVGTTSLLSFLILLLIW